MSKDGYSIATDTPIMVITPAVIAQVFGVEVVTIDTPSHQSLKFVHYQHNNDDYVDNLGIR
jgi:ABC-type cobalamin/Fe3+-siderophores transport system ATPase subunit